ncbi:MAG: (Fe-S)-binding protein [Methanothrix sp.]|jgi:heterodisulfide reductase subunit D|nr:(Fe-S)-binding protein [Methanothrix sp.]OYV11793.1 MAG: heterodisulfide reductase subunit D [Methanosaeta sp. ASO1]OYV13420.1 MAG: heterodisulfide reductase subunit D [Methanosaeta sp. ASM2]MDD1738361.1 (Fe-S)-binding protein [Methanothrix sp.]MDD1739348.1 (Fe-S)-binding protein [Methanothrix sp.]
MADQKNSKPLMSGFMMSTQLLEVDGCNRCQECMKWCPTFAVRPDRPGITPMYKNARWRELMAKSHSLRAKIFGAKPLNDDEMKQFTEDTYSCTTCGVCGTVCEAGIKTVELWEAMRPNLVARGDGPVGKQSFFPKLIGSDRNPYMAKQEERLCWIPKDAKVQESGELVYFAGCTAAYRQQALGVATVRILNKLNVDFAMLGKDEWCCASALIRTGQRDVMAEHAVHNVDALKDAGAKNVLFACAGCLRNAAIDWPMWYEGYIPYETMPLSVFLRDKIKNGEVEYKVPLNYRFTYHDPCHNGRHLMHLKGKDWAFEAPRECVQSIPGVKFQEMVRNRALQRCCGAGGGVKAGIPDLAMDCAMARVQDATDIQAEVIASTCPFCRLNLIDGRNTAKSPIKMVDIVEMMAASMGLDTAIPENPYTKFQSQDVLVCTPTECKLDTVERTEPGKDLVGEAH